MAQGQSRTKIVDGVDCVVWKDKRMVCIINPFVPEFIIPAEL